MPLTLVTTAPDGTQTRTASTHRPVLALVVADTLKGAAPWLADWEARSAGLQVARGELGLTHVHMATGYRFRINTKEI